MRKPSISQLVYGALYPKARPNDPVSFAAHTSRNLVPEVRAETANFYGSLDCLEAQYPGLDYNFPPHRKRLSRFHHHRKLFKVFDELGLTEAEIGSLCRWEGTKSARERYEADEGVKIRDTTMDSFRAATPHSEPTVYIHSWDNGNGIGSHAEYDEVDEMESGSVLGGHALSEGPETEDEEEEDDSSDDGIESYGTRLNERLIEVTAARGRGADVQSDELELFEQWLKEAIERGGYNEMFAAIREGRPIDVLYRDASGFSHTYSPSSPAANTRPQPGAGASRDGSALTVGLPPITLPEPSIGPTQNATTRTT
jgi:hypothetical protein